MGLDHERIRARVEKTLNMNPMAPTLTTDTYTMSEVLTDAFLGALDEMGKQAKEAGLDGILIPVPKGD